MKRTPLAAVSFVLAASALAVVAAAGGTSPAWSSPEGATWTGDTVHSFVLFKTKHLGTSWAFGRFNDFTVSVTTDEAGANVTAVAFDVKAESVDTGNPARDKHVRSPDFLAAAEFPSIAFQSDEVKPAGDGAWDVSGKLSMRGETKPLTVRVLRTGAGKGRGGESLLGLETTFTVKRSDFGHPAKMIGPVGDEMHMTVTAEVAKK